LACLQATQWLLPLGSFLAAKLGFVLYNQTRLSVGGAKTPGVRSALEFSKLRFNQICSTSHSYEICQSEDTNFADPRQINSAAAAS
jgi:hypothetical protein